MIGAITAFLTAVFFHLIFPAIAGSVVAGLISGASLLDPLYAGQRAGAAWNTLGTILLINGLHTVITAVATGAAISYFSAKITSGWLYLFGLFLSILLHGLLLVVFAGGLSASGIREISSTVIVISILVSVLFSAAIVGLITVFAVRRWG